MQNKKKPFDEDKNHLFDNDVHEMKNFEVPVDN